MSSVNRVLNWYVFYLYVYNSIVCRLSGTESAYKVEIWWIYDLMWFWPEAHQSSHRQRSNSMARSTSWMQPRWRNWAYLVKEPMA